MTVVMGPGGSKIASGLVALLIVAWSMTARASNPGEEMTPIANGVRIKFLPAALSNRDCQATDNGVNCYFPEHLAPCAVVSTKPKAIHGRGRVRATLEFSADWQGWVSDAAANATMPMFSFMIVVMKDKEVVNAARRSVVLADLRTQVVQTRAIIEHTCYDYVLAKANRQQVAIELDGASGADEFLNVELDLSELFAAVGVVVHSMTMEVTHDDTA